METGSSSPSPSGECRASNELLMEDAMRVLGVPVTVLDKEGSCSFNLYRQRDNCMYVYVCTYMYVYVCM